MKYQSYRKALETLQATHKYELKKLKAHRKMLTLAKNYANPHAKDLDISTSYVGFEPAVDIDVHLAKDQTIRDVYPLIDDLIRCPVLDMVTPLPATIETKDSTVACKFVEKEQTGYPALRVYIYLSRSSVCVEVGTGQYKEITRVACRHYNEDGTFIED